MDNSSSISRSITRAASRQTFYTIWMLADRELADDAYRAYAYFRWVDDWLDTPGRVPAECRLFAARQRHLIDRCYAGDPPAALEPAGSHPGRSDSRRSGQGQPPGCLYRQHDGRHDVRCRAPRSGDLPGRTECLPAVVVCGRDRGPSLLHWAPRARTQRFGPLPGGHRGPHHTYASRHPRRCPGWLLQYQLGVPERPRISPLDVDHDAYRDWVRMRVDLARRYFAAGRRYFSQVRSRRCRLAAYAYTARFDIVLDMIERDGYVLRQDYGAVQVAWCPPAHGWLGRPILPRPRSSRTGAPFPCNRRILWKPMTRRSVIVIGAGIAGISAAAHLARRGVDVTVVEKNPRAGGRCDQFTRGGHVFDTGPTLLIMPRVYEAEFAALGSISIVSWTCTASIRPIIWSSTTAAG